jgi:hypothetical protein
MRLFDHIDSIDYHGITDIQTMGELDIDANVQQDAVAQVVMKADASSDRVANADVQRFVSEALAENMAKANRKPRTFADAFNDDGPLKGLVTNADVVDAIRVRARGAEFDDGRISRILRKTITFYLQPEKRPIPKRKLAQPK